MNVALGFAPYVVFFVLMRATSADFGLWGALAAALILAAATWSRTGLPKVPEVGAVLLFATLAGFTAVEHWDWTVMSVRLAVDCGLLGIILASLIIGQPFTVQYARERVPEQHWRSPRFVTVNRHITWAWAAAFATMTASHAAVVYMSISEWFDAGVTILALGGALAFTSWYAGRASKYPISR